MKKMGLPPDVVLKILCMGTVLLSMLACSLDGEDKGLPPKPIPNGLLYPSEALKLAWTFVFGRQETERAECEDFSRYHPATYSKPILHAAIPQHPFMAANPGSNMHCDAYMSDTYEARGPLGLDPQVSSRTQGFGGYGTLAYDSARRLVGVYGNGRGFALHLLNPYTLEKLDASPLPSRPWSFLFQGVPPWKYIGAGTYFYLDHQDRAIVPTTDNAILVVQVPAPGGKGTFEQVRRYDLADHVVPMSWPKQDSVAWVLPEWDGKYYWYATTQGMVGTVQVDTGAVRCTPLAGEVIENSFAVGEDGVFIISDRALYRFSQDGQGSMVTDWRTKYDPGPAPKPGHITRGSGVSVTLMGGRDGLAAIADNAEPRINLMFFRRSDGAVVCRIPVFEEGKSGTDLTVIGFEHADDTGAGTGVYSVIVENNWGHHRFPLSRPVPGLTRVDVTRHDDGTYSCKEIWASQEKSIGGFRLSLGNGLVYIYRKIESCPVTQWYFTAIDFRTGETVYRKRTGTGLGYNNWQASLFLHPDGGIAYSTTIFGLVMLRDAPP